VPRFWVPCEIRGQNNSTYEPAPILRRDEAAQRQPTSRCVCNVRLAIASGDCDSVDGSWSDSARNEIICQDYGSSQNTPDITARIDRGDQRGATLSQDHGKVATPKSHPDALVPSRKTRRSSMLARWSAAFRASINRAWTRMRLAARIARRVFKA